MPNVASFCRPSHRRKATIRCSVSAESSYCLPREERVSGCVSLQYIYFPKEFPCGLYYLQKAADDLLAHIILIGGEEWRFQELERASRKVIFGMQVFSYISIAHQQCSPFLSTLQRRALRGGGRGDERSFYPPK